MDWVLDWEPEGHRFNSQSGNSQSCAWVACQVPSWGHLWDNHTLMILFLSFSLPSPLSRTKWIKKNKKKKRTNWQRGEGECWAKEREGSSQETCTEDPWTKTTGCGARTDCGRWGLGRSRESYRGKMRATVIEQQFKKSLSIKSKV